MIIHFYEAVNEKGLGMAGLNFPDNANYQEVAKIRLMLHPLNSFLGYCHNVNLLQKLRDYVKSQYNKRSFQLRFSTKSATLVGSRPS